LNGRTFQLLLFAVVTAGSALLPLALSRSVRPSTGLLDGPRLVAPRRHIELVPTGHPEQLTARFTVLNRGTRRLVLQALDSACPCGADEKLPATIMVDPGDSYVLELRPVRARDRRAISKTIRFTTNDPANPIVEFSSHTIAPLDAVVLDQIAR
jgi:hypothetical protein